MFLLGKDVSRTELIELVLGLRNVIVPAEARPIEINDWHQVRGLLAAARRAQARAATHIAEGGHAAQVVAAVIRFGIDGASETLDAKSAVVSLPLVWPRTGKGTSSLEVALVRHGSQLFPSFPSPLPVPWSSAAGPSQYLSFDIQAVSGVAKLSLPYVRLNQDGSHHNGVGLSTLIGTRATVTKALVEGLLCLVAVRSSVVDRPGEYARAVSANRGVHALHLDARW
jgi:hypothetical protein